jgi:hypothetical protein
VSSAQAGSGTEPGDSRRTCPQPPTFPPAQEWARAGFNGPEGRALSAVRCPRPARCGPPPADSTRCVRLARSSQRRHTVWPLDWDAASARECNCKAQTALCVRLISRDRDAPAVTHTAAVRRYPHQRGPGGRLRAWTARGVLISRDRYAPAPQSGKQCGCWARPCTSAAGKGD